MIFGDENNVITTLRNLVEEGHSQSALDLADNFLKGRSSDASRVQIRPLLHSIILLRARARRFSINRLQGTASAPEIEAEEARFELAVLRLIDEIERLGGSVVVKPFVNFAKDFAPEKLMSSDSHLRSVGWLARGLSLSSAVCRLTDSETFGSGFRCAPCAVLTNHHVIPTELSARRFRADFFFEEDMAGNVKAPLSVAIASSPFWTSPKLDITLVGMAEPPHGSMIETLTLRTNLSAGLNEHVSIIQHPEGGPKQMAVTNNRVLNLFDPFIHYYTDTLPGSSGSPVFLDTWEIVAIHRAGGHVPKNAKGELLFANEGILISALLKDREFLAAAHACGMSISSANT